MCRFNSFSPGQKAIHVGITRGFMKTPGFCPSLSYHIVCKRIAKVTDFLSFCPFGISVFPFLTIGISMYQKHIYPILLFPLLSHPKLLPLWSVTDGRTTFFTPCYLRYFFSTERAGPYPQAQLYWAGRTMGWMADWTRLKWVLKQGISFNPPPYIRPL